MTMRRQVAGSSLAPAQETSEEQQADSVQRALSLDRWRRVASTHRLEELWDPECKPPWPDGSKFLLGLACIAASLVTAVAGSMWFICIGLAGAPASIVYYVQLVLACIPVTVVYIILNWFCIKLFKHNT
jgi:hypothetical protein